MRFKALCTIVLVAACTRRAHAQSLPSRATVDSMIAFFAGHWGCEGKFASGSPIAADVVFAAQLDNRWLSYSHVDRAPGRFRMQALWGYDAAAKGLVSAAADNGGGLRIFRAPGWTDGSVTFERVLLSDTIPRPERFTYKRESDNTFRMTYEVRRGASPWVMGDYVVCTRG